MTVVYTAVLGNTDPLHEVVVKGDARYVCFTDQDIHSKTWEIIRVPKADKPATESRKYKALPHVYFGDFPTIWVDACLDLFFKPEELLEKYQGPITNFSHPDRTRITQEAAAIVKIKKADPRDIQKQLEAYWGEGFDTDKNPMTSLSNNGFILRRNCQELNELWWSEIQKHTRRDQMSLDYCAWKIGVTINRFSGTIRNNPYVKYNHYNRPTND